MWARVNIYQIVMVNVHQAKTQLSRLLKRVHEGGEIVLAKAQYAFETISTLFRMEVLKNII